MPLPKPNENEKRDQFIDRCMADETMNEEYSDNSQRFAVCNNIYDRRNERTEGKAMSIDTNKAGITYANSLIKAGKINEGSWSFSASDGNKLLGEDGEDWKNYSKHHLAIDTEQDEETRGYYKFPFAKGEEIYRRGVVAVKQRATQQGYTDIEDAADKLLTAIDNKLGAGEEEEERSYYVPSRKEMFGTLQKDEDNYIIVASSNVIDRDNEIIEPTAFSNLGSYLRKNPVILFGHNYQIPPVGKAKNGKITKDGLILEIEFAKTDFGKEVKYLYDNGFMNSFSVGFIPRSYEPNNEGIMTYTDVELLEVSAVPVPANASANIIRATKGLKNYERYYKTYMENKTYKGKIEESLAKAKKEAILSQLEKIKLRFRR